MLEVGRDLLEHEAGLELQLAGRVVVEHRVDADARDRAGERRARADVRAEAERQVLIGVLAVEDELVGVGEMTLVAIGRRRADDDTFARVHGTARDLGVAHAAASQEQQRR